MRHLSAYTHLVGWEAAVKALGLAPRNVRRDKGHKEALHQA